MAVDPALGDIRARTPMMLSVSIMAHPQRAGFIDGLREKLGPVPVSFDEGIGIWENCKRSWRLHPMDSEYHTVIQDDAIVCDHFQSMAVSAIRDARSVTGSDWPALSFFFGKRKMMQEVAKKGLRDGHITKSMLHWGLAVCLPVRLIDEMIAYGDKLKIKQDDARISKFLLSRKIPVYYPMPSLVDHRIGESLVGDPGRARNAYAYIDRYED
jgi:hypothetical protein